MEGGNEVTVVCRSGKTLGPLKEHESRAQAGAYVDRNIEYRGLDREAPDEESLLGVCWRAE